MSRAGEDVVDLEKRGVNFGDESMRSRQAKDNGMNQKDENTMICGIMGQEEEG